VCVLFFWPLFFSGGVKLSLVSVFSWLIFSFGTAKHVEKKTKNKNMNKKKNKEKKTLHCQNKAEPSFAERDG